MERWPALFTEGQILAEFCHLSSKNLKTEFFKELDKYTPRFFEIFKTMGELLARNFRIICNKSHQRIQMLLRSIQQSSMAFLSSLEMRTQTSSRHALTAMTQACLTFPLES